MFCMFTLQEFLFPYPDGVAVSLKPFDVGDRLNNIGETEEPLPREAEHAGALVEVIHAER